MGRREPHSRQARRAQLPHKPAVRRPGCKRGADALHDQCTNRGGRLKTQPLRPPTSKTCKGAKMLSNIIGLVSGCVTFLGSFLVVWGAVSRARHPRQQGGAQIASAISTIAGGAIIIAAAISLGQLDTSWLPA